LCEECFIKEQEEEEEEEEDTLQCDICNNYVSYLKNGLCNKCEEEQEEEEERFCDNKDCPYEGFCCYEVKEGFKGKPWICVGCATGKGLQEEEEEARKKIFKFIKYHYFNYHKDFLYDLDMGFTCCCGEVRDMVSGFCFHYYEDEYICLNCRDELNEDDKFEVCGECYNRKNHCSKCDGCKCYDCECEEEEEE